MGQQAEVKTSVKSSSKTIFSNNGFVQDYIHIFYFLITFFWYDYIYPYYAVQHDVVDDMTSMYEYDSIIIAV